MLTSLHVFRWDRCIQWNNWSCTTCLFPCTNPYILTLPSLTVLNYGEGVGLFTNTVILIELHVLFPLDATPWHHSNSKSAILFDRAFGACARAQGQSNRQCWGTTLSERHLRDMGGMQSFNLTMAQIVRSGYKSLKTTLKSPGSGILSK